MEALQNIIKLLESVPLNQRKVVVSEFLSKLNPKITKEQISSIVLQLDKLIEEQPTTITPISPTLPGGGSRKKRKTRKASKVSKKPKASKKSKKVKAPRRRKSRKGKH